MAPACVARAKATLGSLWRVLQFEHHGVYSLERAQLLLSYLREHSIELKTPLTLVLTPVPCVVALTLMDCIPLQDPSRGAEANVGFLVRSLLAVMGYTGFIVGQIHVCVPNLLRMRSLLWIAPLVAAATNGANYLMSLWIGFPLPFTHVLGLVPWVSSLLMSLWIAIGSEGRHSQTVRRAFNEHGALIMAQSSLGVVYPLFYRLFLVSSPTAQFFVVLLLPVIKLAMKFRIHQVTPHIQDLQPVTLTFNAEVFNSLFTASCMRGSSSTVTSIALMSIDFLHSTYCLVRLNGLVASVEQLGMQFKVSREQMLPAVALLAKKIPQEVWEYLVLVEYTEVIVPMVYGTYLSLSYNLPTRAYYSLLKDLDESEMRRVVTNIYLYGLLQLLSFVLLNFVLLRRLRIAAHHQVAFVLREHWQFVQCNLVLWMVYTIQSSLEHVGMDYSFQFVWLKNASSSSS